MSQRGHDDGSRNGLGLHGNGTAITVGRLRELTVELPDDTPLIVAIRDRHHVDTQLADVLVVGARVTSGPDHRPVVVFEAEGVS